MPVRKGCCAPAVWGGRRYTFGAIENVRVKISTKLLLICHEYYTILGACSCYEISVASMVLQCICIIFLIKYKKEIFNKPYLYQNSKDIATKYETD